MICGNTSELVLTSDSRLFLPEQLWEYEFAKEANFFSILKEKVLQKSLLNHFNALLER